MGSLGGEQKGAHVLAIPYPQKGHMIPMLRLATELARRGITVSFVCYEDEIPRLSASTGADDASSEQPTSLDCFRFVTVRKPRPEGPDPFESLAVFQEASEPLLKRLVQDKTAGVSAGPTCVISDAFLPFTQNAAEELQISRYSFIPSGANFVRLMQGCIELFERGQFQVSETDGTLVKSDQLIRILGLPPLRYDELDFFLRTFPAGFLVVAKSTVKATGIVVNSFFELEENIVEICRSSGHPLDRHGKVPKVYPVGPLFSTKVISNSTAVKGLGDSSSKCRRWLGSQSASSVLYVAFGSHVRLHPEEIIEMAHGLEASNQHFLWVIPLSKENPSLSEVLPPGFEARLGNRGCIVTGWAPQLEILAHPSTRGFMSHAGWNSCLESISFGVPMVLLPKQAEQHLNCRLLVDELKVAVQLEIGEDGSIKRDEVERAARLLMLDSEGAAIRSTMQELQGKAAAATAVEGGSKSRIFQEFVDDICGNYDVPGNSTEG